MEDEDHFTMLDAVNMCVTVIAYNGDNARAVQMMVSAWWHPPILEPTHDAYIYKDSSYY